MAASLYRMYLSIKCDREVDRRNKHAFTPGGYEICYKDKCIAFDFCDFKGWIDEDDRTIIHCVLRNPDLDSFPEIKDITLEGLKSKDISFSEFFVFNGEEGEERCYPLELLELSFEFYDAENDKIIPYGFEDNQEGLNKLLFMASSLMLRNITIGDADEAVKATWKRLNEKYEYEVI